MGEIKGICISEKRGTQKHEVESVVFVKDWGIEGDAHAGKWHRQVSLLSFEKIEAFRAALATGLETSFGEAAFLSGALEVAGDAAADFGMAVFAVCSERIFLSWNRLAVSLIRSSATNSFKVSSLIAMRLSIVFMISVICI